MITQKTDPARLKRQLPYVALTISGACLNIISLFIENSGAFVAVGCSLIVIGTVLAARQK